MSEMPRRKAPVSLAASHGVAVPWKQALSSDSSFATWVIGPIPPSSLQTDLLDRSASPDISKCGHAAFQSSGQCWTLICKKPELAPQQCLKCCWLPEEGTLLWHGLVALAQLLLCAPTQSGTAAGQPGKSPGLYTSVVPAQSFPGCCN